MLGGRCWICWVIVCKGLHKGSAFGGFAPSPPLTGLGTSELSVGGLLLLAPVHGPLLSDRSEGLDVFGMAAGEDDI